ncbi:MAG TPA: citrate lyase acyl carrier protein [Acholeplasmataceae bacterium]|jgi:citrate lyase subunit gamma (acyl carrier protein)|nr:citrate lyase acyl carrier protein [Acholeplasmataceae bacterium]
MKIGLAGSIESSDCLITAEASNELDIKIESSVYEFFGKQIRKVILETLEELGIKTIRIHINDKGALDYTIRSRLISAIKRMES